MRRMSTRPIWRASNSRQQRDRSLPGAGVEKAVLGARADPAAQQGWTLLFDGPRLQIGQDTNRSKNLLRRCGGKQAQTK